MTRLRISVWSTLVLLLSLQALASPMGSTPQKVTMKSQPSIVIKTPLKSVQFQIELATTPEDRRRGLMFREQLPENEGMLFIFPRTQHHSFWMKNTFIPLDMIFIDKDKRIVGIVENAEPMTTEKRAVPTASKYVLELNAGTCRKYQIHANQKVVFQHVDIQKVR